MWPLNDEPTKSHSFNSILLGLDGFESPPDPSRAGARVIGARPKRRMTSGKNGREEIFSPIKRTSQRGAISHKPSVKTAIRRVNKPNATRAKLMVDQKDFLALQMSVQPNQIIIRHRSQPVQIEIA